MTRNRHIFTIEERQRGGWARARQKADERRANPSPLELKVHEALRQIGLVFETEFEIMTGAYPQFVDVWVTDPRVPQFAIEVDGGKAWHGDYPSSKMHEYDRTKEAYLRAISVPLLRIKPGNAVVEKITDFMREYHIMDYVGKEWAQ